MSDLHNQRPTEPWNSMSSSDGLGEEALSAYTLELLWCMKEDIIALLLEAPADQQDAKTPDHQVINDVCSEFDMVRTSKYDYHSPQALSLTRCLQTHRWATRIDAVDEVRRLSFAQERECMLDRRNKGGKSLLMKCSGTVLENVPCVFHAKLRRSSKDSMWYLCKGCNLKHTCCVQVKTRNGPLRNGSWKVPCFSIRFQLRFLEKFLEGLFWSKLF